MILLDYQNRQPLYEHITEKFRILILSGAMTAGTRMPSVRQLAVELSINPNTIQRAYMELEQQGLIYPVKGKGNFVADTAEITRIGREDYLREFRGLSDKGRDMGIRKKELLSVIEDCYKEGEND